MQESGGDQVTAEVVTDTGAVIETRVVGRWPVTSSSAPRCPVADLENGSYEVRFTPATAGPHCLKVAVFGRAIRDCPQLFSVTRHNKPLLSFGRRGAGPEEFVQPCGAALDTQHRLYVADTGNTRIKGRAAEWCEDPLFYYNKAITPL